MSNPNTQKLTVRLEHPVQLADRLLTEVILRRMTVGDMIDIPIPQTGDVAAMTRMIARLANLSPEDIRELDVSDFIKVNEEVNRFLGVTSN